MTRKKSTTNRLAWITIFSLIIVGIRFEPAMACSSTEADWWFTERVSISWSDRPIGVGYGPNSKAEGFNVTRARVGIVNHTGTNMYVLAHSVPPDHIPIEQPTEWVPSDLIAIDRFRASNGISFDGSDLQYIASDFDDYNVQEPDRPDDLTAPPAQESEIKILFGEQLITLSIQFEYALNSNYDPGHGIDRCGYIIFASPSLLFFRLLDWSLLNIHIVLGITLVVWLGSSLYFVFRPESNESSINS